MARTDVYLKVEVDLPDSDRTKDRPERLAAEICRMIRKVYGVRNAELTNYVNKDE